MYNYEDKIEAQKETYEFIGMYSVVFQKIIFQLQDMIRWIFQAKGLEEIQLINIFFADRSAMDILVLARGLFNQVYTPQNEEKKISDNIFKDIQKAIEWRNDLFHGQNFIGYYSEQTEFNSFLCERIKKGKQGLIHKFEKKDIEDLQNNTNNAIDLAKKIYQLRHYFYISKFFEPIPISLADYLEDISNVQI